MVYNVKSRIDFPIQKAIFFRGLNFTVAGTATSPARSGSSRRDGGTGRELKGNVHEPRTRRATRGASPTCHGSLSGTTRVPRSPTYHGLYGGPAKFDY
jgi:hypothetical protein